MLRRMGRTRNTGNIDLGSRPGLYPPTPKNPCWRMRNPFDKGSKPTSLGVKDKDQAFALYDALAAELRPANLQAQADKLSSAFKPRAVTPLLTTFAADYRENQLEKALSKRKNKPLGKEVRKAYKNMLLNNIEPATLLAVPISAYSDPDAGPMRLRQFLAAWMEKPSMYNYMLDCLTRVFDQAVDEGMLGTNPCRAINRRGKPKREVYIPDHDYLAITAKMTELSGFEVYARACDLLYILSHRPGDVLAITEDGIDQDHTVRFTAAKNEQPMVITPYDKDGAYNEDQRDIIEWFRAYKRKQGLVFVTRHLAVHPMEADRRIAAKPITREWLYRLWVDALQALEIPIGTYTLRDIRPKALTDEAEAEGAPTNKGGHQTEQSRRHYVKRRLPAIVRNNLRRIGG